MYIRKKILSAVNEEYYRNHVGSGLKALKDDFIAEDVNENINVLHGIKKKDPEMLNLYLDLYAISLGVNDAGSMFDEKYESKLGNELLIVKHYYEDILKNNFLPNSEIYFEVVNILLQESHQSYLVGGFIRDAILGVESKDMDFATDTPYKVLKEAFKARGFGIKEEGEAFLVMIVSKVNKSGKTEQYDVANFRKDANTSEDSRHPDYVEIGTMKDDAFRRDFTVNALFYDLFNEKLIDPTGYGIDDISNNLLRFVGKPQERLDEDAIRLWRAYRFASSKGLEIERKTEKALRSNFDACYKRSNPARVLQEMIKF